MDLFSIRIKQATHKRTGVIVVIIKEIWINGMLHYDCAIPQCDDGKKWYFANATYSESELIIN